MGDTPNVIAQFNASPAFDVRGGGWRATHASPYAVRRALCCTRAPQGRAGAD